MTRLDGSFRPRRRPEEPWRRNTPFTRVSRQLAEIPRDSWKAVDAGLWNFDDPIALGEGRAVVRLLKILSSQPSAHNHRVISLQDNTVISGSFTKGRSPAPAVNHLAR